VNVALALERRADRADAAVHHVARRHDVRARLGMRQRLAHERADRHVVHDVPGLVDDAVESVRRERIERDVRDHAECRQRLLERARGALRQAFRVPRLAPIIGLRLGRGHREQRESRNAERGDLLGLAHDLVDREPLDPGHRRHGHALSPAFHDEHGIDQVVGRQQRLAHQPPREVVAPHAAQANVRVLLGIALATHRVLRRPAAPVCVGGQSAAKVPSCRRPPAPVCSLTGTK
jgi:hypothetical protein